MHKFEKQIIEGYQYCEKCGKAIPVECNHKWETIVETEISPEYNPRVYIAKMYILKCISCGEIKKNES